MSDIPIPAEALTQARLRDLIKYDALSGEFTWLQTVNSRATAGSRAGSKNSHGYVFIKVDGKRYAAHRLAWLWMYGTFPRKQLDHINRDRSDNRISNLREASSGENQQNRPIQINNRSGVPGVCWYSRDKKWHARICLNGKHIHLGMYDTIEKAASARRAAKERHHPFSPRD